MILTVYTSTTLDGPMKPLSKNDITRCAKARKDFLAHHDIASDETTCVWLEYDRNDYCQYKTINESYKGDGMTRPSSIIIDALVVTESGHALFLPLADCIGVVLHDPTQNILMVSHLGRHNLEQFGGTESVKYLMKKHAVRPKNLRIWLSPAAGNESYPLFAFDNRSLHDVAVEQIEKAGVPFKNIDVSPIHTTSDENYYSHSEFLKGHRKTDGRFAIAAVMR